MTRFVIISRIWTGAARPAARDPDGAQRDLPSGSQSGWKAIRLAESERATRQSGRVAAQSIIQDLDGLPGHPPSGTQTSCRAIKAGHSAVRHTGPGWVARQSAIQNPNGLQPGRRSLPLPYARPTAREPGVSQRDPSSEPRTGCRAIRTRRSPIRPNKTSREVPRRNLPPYDKSIKRRTEPHL